MVHHDTQKPLTTKHLNLTVVETINSVNLEIVATGSYSQTSRFEKFSVATKIDGVLRCLLHLLDRLLLLEGQVTTLHRFDLCEPSLKFA